MGAFPSSDLPGNKRLKARIEIALGNCLETSNVEFKGSSTWPAIRYKLLKTAMAMANLRDGGLIIIGVAERPEGVILDGIDDADLQTFNADVIVDFIAKFASPAPKISAVLHTIADNDKSFLVIQIHEYIELPVICRKDAQDGGDMLHAGDVYIRPSEGRPRSERIKAASDMRDLIELAAEKRVRSMLESARRAGMLDIQPIENPYDAELGDL